MDSEKGLKYSKNHKRTFAIIAMIIALNDVKGVHTDKIISRDRLGP